MAYSSALLSKKVTLAIKSPTSAYYFIFSLVSKEMCFVETEQWISNWLQVINIWILQDVN